MAHLFIFFFWTSFACGACFWDLLHKAVVFGVAAILSGRTDLLLFTWVFLSVPITLNSLITGWYFGIFSFSSFKVVSCLLSSIVFTFSGQSSGSAEVKPV